ncbi:hypothetical protein DY000_02025131 [Brassica cretica]|uniref:Uncharacterized protein n=1 Tax=Brassica cretica TaxID=69181 RepID=A0ABQ7E5S1_BRACR|nr:hypothetical protein DY000_02025131 [Brassica cretica]
MEDMLSRALAQVKWEEDVASSAKAQQNQDPKAVRPDRNERDKRPSPRPTMDSGNISRGRYKNRPIEKAEGMKVSTWPDISYLSIQKPELVNVLRQMGQQVKWPQKMKAPDSFRNPGLWMRCKLSLMSTTPRESSSGVDRKHESLSIDAGIVWAIGSEVVPLVDIEVVPSVDVEVVPSVDVEVILSVDVEVVPSVDVEVVSSVDVEVVPSVDVEVVSLVDVEVELPLPALSTLLCSSEPWCSSSSAIM